VYGNANLWYILADANAIDSDAELVAGAQLRVPDVKVNSNDASTFKPFDPSTATGPTNPSLPYIPKPSESGCGTLGTIIMVVVAVVVTVYTAGAAAGAMASALGAASGAAAAGGTFAAGSAALAGAYGTTTAVVAGAAGAFAGSVASQAVGSAIGQTSFSWRNVAASTLAGAATAGFGAYANTTALAASPMLNAMATAAVGNVSAYAAGRLAGNDASFSWRSVAASAVSAGVTARLAPSVSQKLGVEGGRVGSSMVSGITGGVVSAHVRQGLIGGGVDYQDVFVDAFGNTLMGALSRNTDRVQPTTTMSLSDAPTYLLASNGAWAVGMGLPEEFWPLAAGNGDARSNAIDVAASQASMAEEIPTLDTVQAVADRYSSGGWYFYGWNNYGQQWMDLQRTRIDQVGWSRPPATPTQYNSAVGAFIDELQADMARQPRPFWQQSASERFGLDGPVQLSMKADIDPQTGRAWPQSQAYDPENPGPMTPQALRQAKRAQQIENNRRLDERVGNLLAFFGPRADNGTVSGQFVNPITGERVSNSQREAAIGDIFNTATLFVGPGTVSRTVPGRVANAGAVSEAATNAQFSRNYASGRYRSLDLSINERGLLAQERLQAQAAGWKRADGSTWWPPYDGAIPGTQRMITLEPSLPEAPLNLIDRYGGTGGYFVSPAGVPLDARALASTPSGLPNVYSINGAIPSVERASIAPWFGQRGTGVQYRLPDRVQYYLDMKTLGEVK